MKRADFEMLSNEELKIMLEDSSSYSEAEIACVKEILQERKTSTNNAKIDAAISRNDEIPGYSIDAPDKGWSQLDIQGIKENVRTIKNCAIFFVVLMVLAMILGFVAVIQAVENLTNVL